MVTPPLSEPEDEQSSEVEENAEIAVCEGSPGTYIFIEDGNSDGWIGTDTVVELRE